MLAFIIAPFFIALLIFVFFRTIKYIEIYHIRGIKIIEILFAFILFAGFCFLVASFLIPSGIVLKRIFTRVGYYWLGIILYFLIGLLFALIIRGIFWVFFKNKGYNKILARKITAIFVIFFTFTMSIYGINNAHKLRITNYDVTINKESKIDDINIVLISDLHLGYNVGINEVEDMANSINKLNPDVVVLAGDLFDNEYDALEDPKTLAKLLNNIDSNYGKYVVLGNHDVEEKILAGFSFSLADKTKASADERMLKFIEDSGFKILYDSYELIKDSVYIYGRPDAIKYNFGNNSRVEANKICEGLDLNKTIICVDHEPGELIELSNAGVDLDLCGHTHNGQIWPGTITIKMFWDNAYGIKKINNMTSIVTSGVGLFGINMRTGCFPEIVNIRLSFNK